jgi:hypothetical protein
MGRRLGRLEYMVDLTTIFHHLQRQLFPALTAELGPLSALDQPFCEVMTFTDLGRFTRRYQFHLLPVEGHDAQLLRSGKRAALERLNPALPPEAITAAVDN